MDGREALKLPVENPQLEQWADCGVGLVVWFAGGPAGLVSTPSTQWGHATDCVLGAALLPCDCGPGGHWLALMLDPIETRDGANTPNISPCMVSVCAPALSSVSHSYTEPACEASD